MKQPCQRVEAAEGSAISVLTERAGSVGNARKDTRIAAYA
jgi:hypothetical protein